MRVRTLLMPRRWRHMRAVHPRFQLAGDPSAPDAWSILWRGAHVGRTEPLRALRRPSSSSCFVVASGPSVAGQDLSVLQSRPCIGVNGSIVKADAAGLSFDYHVIVDRKFVADRFDLVERVLRSSADCLLSFRVLSEICVQRPELLARDRLFLLPEINSGYGVERLGPAAFARWVAGREYLIVPGQQGLHRLALRHPHRVGFSKRLEAGVFTAQTVAFVALQVAYALGARRVFLLGVDLGGSGSSGRFYESGAQAAPSRLDRDLEPYILPSFALAGRLRQSEGFAVFNLSPTSLLPEEAIPTLSIDQAIELCDRSESDERRASS
jgi:KDO transferase-3